MEGGLPRICYTGMGVRAGLAMSALAAATASNCPLGKGGENWQREKSQPLDSSYGLHWVKPVKIHYLV